MSPLIRHRTILLSLLVLCPYLALAAIVPDCPNDVCTYENLVGEGGLLTNFINFLVNVLAIPLAVLMIVWGGAIMVTQADKPDARAKGKKIIWTAIRGLLITFSAYLIVKFVVVGLGGSDGAYNIFN